MPDDAPYTFGEIELTPAFLALLEALGAARFNREESD